MVFHGKWYDEVALGERFGTSLTVTETHFVLGSGLFGDFNPLHVNEVFAQRSQFGSRILHGPFTSALVSAPVGMFFAGSAIAYLEHACRFKAPVRAGDTLATEWTVREKLDKPKHQRRHRGHGRRVHEPARRRRSRGRRQDPGRLAPGEAT